MTRARRGVPAEMTREAAALVALRGLDDGPAHPR